ncbi:MAG: class I SAM-dependent methyltransferase [Clostridiales Family XIII bacterium]|nr:class I SAM-dependent methyltransferase [Clostridiales Family XIII bacterium]
MIRLSDRLEKIASCVASGESLADVGTDHGLLPMALHERGVSRRLVLCDVNEGPLEKTRDGLRRRGFARDAAPSGEARGSGGRAAGSGEFWGEGAFELRKGSGLEPLEAGEVDAVALAGMGGRLIIDILAADLEKSRSFGKYALQPRNAADKLREWLARNGFPVREDGLAMEGGHICTVMLAVPRPGAAARGRAEAAGPSAFGGERLRRVVSSLESCGAAYDMSEGLIARRDPLLAEWLERKLRTFDRILASMADSGIGPHETADAIAAKRDAYSEALRYIRDGD